MTPAETIDMARLASDPMVHLGTLKVREALRRWLESGAGHECRITLRQTRTVGLAWCVDLLDAHTCVASELRANLDDALAHALQQVKR
jgi:hypothetical protein